jgi:enoyl-CoA hydratase/carnithine racemase
MSNDPKDTAVTSRPSPQRLEIEVRDSIAIVAFNRPDVRNAIDDDMRTEFADVLDWVARDDTIRAMVLTGRGKAFCAGGDIAAMAERLKAPAGRIAVNGWQRQRRTHHAIANLHGLAKPTVAAVNGAAAGLGCDIALCCDFIVASSQYASFVMSYVMRGLIPDGGGLYFLPRRVGLQRAKDMIFSARKVDATEALSIGLVDQLAEPDRLVDDAVDLARRMIVGSLDAVALSKTILDQSFELQVEQVFALGAQAQAICYTTEAHRASVEEFLGKRSR